MNCGRIRPLLSAFVDGEATQEEISSVQRHLASCADCAAVLHDYREIGANIRRMSRPVPPANLRNNVLSQLGSRRQRGLVFGRSAASLVGLVGVAAVIIILVLGLTTVYQRAVAPQDLNVTASRPVDLSNDVPVNVAISLEFNRPMDAQSVKVALKANPPFPYVESWQGNKLEIIPQATLQPDTDYTLSIDGSAKDQSGAALKKSFSVSFHTKKVEDVATKPPTEPVIVPGASTAVPSATSLPVVTATGTVTITVTPMPQSGTAEPTAPTGTPSPGPTSTETPAATHTPGPTGTPSEIPTSPPMQGTPTPVNPPGTATQAPAPGSPPGTATLPVPGSPTPTATLPPLQNYTITPVRGFGLVYYGHAQVSQGLGAAVEDEKQVNATEQLFEKGSMYWREDTGQVYVFFNDATQRVFGYSLNGPLTNGTADTSLSGLSEPTGVFAKLWHEQPGLRDKLGLALQPERSFTAVAQAFEHGTMLWSDRKVIYVVYDSGASAQFPDLFQQ